ncbi:anthranilate phosphoribosyltransferase [Rhodocytophaga aerolata]|uniref:Anthranilate phosphoribosyltransferase n=1 Tax=Rhodocytophaga aerolata TaxID=455078 RepID=A0ABT8RER7_9BACT|nr:anthranilate phosphoribosyltransferase [Rhodocytophaga aerolata]MDO1450616.1 anthranilate phosphoribosyltransferase [Rhodocytophaga aerolata]
MKEILNHLFEYKTLTKDQARTVLTDITQGNYTHVQIASFLTVYMMRSITVAELEGFRDAMLEQCLALDFSAYDPMDVCGTGGDGKNTFNISTLASFVVAGAGQRVVKHGNYAVSSTCGSSTVMEYLGYKFTNDKDILRRKIEEAGICFLHAPLFHPAMKYVAPVRKELGVKTFFNMLGPMVNPAFPQKQMVGVFSLELARLYAYLYQQTTKQFAIVHALDGYDEISLTGNFKMISTKKEQVLSPDQLGLPTVAASDLFGGETVEEAARIFTDVLQGRGTLAQNSAVIANAAMALYGANPAISLEEAIATARESLESKKALRSFEKLMV